MDEMNRIRGVFFGQLIGDSLGSRYEFTSVEKVKILISKDRREDSFLPILGGGPFSMRPGQVTDDSEMALALTESLLQNKTYLQEDVARNYVRWVESHPPDIGITTVNALGGNGMFLQKNQKKELLENVFRNVKKHNSESLSNGSLMRQSPLAIAFRNHSDLLEAVTKDTNLTHIHQTAIDASCIYIFALAELIKGKSPQVT